MSKQVWPKPGRSYKSRSRHRFVVQFAELGKSPWSDAESFPFLWMAVIFYMMMPLWQSGRRQIVDQRGDDRD